MTQAAAGAVPGPEINFLAHCTVSREAPDDPIVYPGEPGVSHDHTFFGNRRIKASSTYSTLVGGSTTCGRKGDNAAYWVPTLFLHGRVVKPFDAVTYYTLREGTDVHPYPRGLKIVAGNAHATTPQPTDVAWWTCSTPGVAKVGAAPPRDCSMSAVLARSNPGVRVHRVPLVGIQLHVRFPNCWDGRRLDSPNHASHMAYSIGERCPASHPVLVPSLILIVTYPIPSGTGVELASGGRFSGHADFFNAWNQSILNRIVKQCRRALPRCASR